MKKITQKIRQSPINYFSDLFIVSMVMAWIITIIIMTAFAIYATIALRDTSVWSYLTEIVSIPLSSGAAVWMIKNGVQHAIANKNGKRAHMDFPKVDVEDIEYETEVGEENSEAKFDETDDNNEELD